MNYKWSLGQMHYKRTGVGKLGADAFLGADRNFSSGTVLSLINAHIVAWRTLAYILVRMSEQNDTTQLKRFPGPL